MAFSEGKSKGRRGASRQIVAKTCSHCKKEQEEGKAEHIPGGAQSSVDEQSKEAG